MNLKAEENTYIFSQLLNTKDSDQGTILFVEHLFKSGKLLYLQTLFPYGIEFHTNKDLVYLIASESLLEKLALQFDSFIRSIPNNSDKEIYPDTASNAMSLVTAVGEFKNTLNSFNDDFSLAALFDCVGRFTKKSLQLLKPLKSQNSGIYTSVDDLMELLKYIRSLNLDTTLSGMHFCFKNFKFK